MTRRTQGRIRARAIGAVSGVAALAVTGMVAMPAAAAPGDGTLTVEVNRDFSGDGVYDPTFDPGQEGLDVTVTDGTTTVGPLTTNGDGQVSVDLSAFAGSKFRVDVTIPASAPGYLEFAPAATSGTTSAFRSATTFVDGATQTIHVGVWNPANYVTRNPQVALAQQLQRTAAGAKRTLMVTDWDNRGPLDMSTTDNTTGIRQVASQAETGSVFGTAWEHRTNSLFSAAYAKANTAYGPGGNGAIYRTDTSTANPTGNTTVWATIPNAGTSAHEVATGHDAAFFLAAGSEGLGGLALSEDGATLYAVNLNDKTLYSLPTAGTAPVTPTPVAVISDPGCVGGDWRPFAVTQRDRTVYVGGICDASTSLKRADLSVHILKLDAGSFTEVYSHDLAFIRGSQAYSDPASNMTDPQVSLHWNPWRDAWAADLTEAMGKAQPSGSVTPIYPMPLLTTFAFENDGSIILDFRDRKTDALVADGYAPDGVTEIRGHVAGGDLNKVCLTNGVFEWEGTGACPNNATTANSAQPAGRVEFFPGEFMTGQARYGSNVAHTENALGAVLLSPREKDIISTTMNPTSLYNSGGLGWYDRVQGTGPGNDWAANGLLVAGNSTSGNFGKGSGLGGVSLLASPAPIQIGNYVWFDENRNGTQDPSELAVPGATVRLLSPDGTVLTSTTTDENGEYYFGGEGGYPLVPGQDYIVEFDLSTVDPSKLPGSPALADLGYTEAQNPDAGSIHDSNPTPLPDNPLIGQTKVTAPNHPGGVDHTIDAGIHYARPAIDIVKFDGRQVAPVNPVDGPDAVDGTYGGPTAGDWDAGVDADTQDVAVQYPLTDGSTGPQPVSMIVTNTGNVSISEVKVADLTVQGPAITALSCDFSPLGGPSSGTSWAGPFLPGDSFTCTSSLTMGASQTHNDIASVTGQPVTGTGEPFGPTVGDEDGYWAVTPQNLVPSLEITKRQSGTGLEADTAGEAIAAAAGETVHVEMPVTNTGNAPLTQVVVTDRTDNGPAMTEFACVFPDGTTVSAVDGAVRWAATFGEPAAAAWEPGATFTCTGVVTLGPGQTHADTVMVSAVTPDGKTLTDDNPFHVQTPPTVPTKPAPSVSVVTPPKPGLPSTGGAISTGAMALGGLLLGLGVLVVLARRRSSTTQR